MLTGSAIDRFEPRSLKNDRQMSSLLIESGP